MHEPHSIDPLRSPSAQGACSASALSRYLLATALAIMLAAAEGCSPSPSCKSDSGCPVGSHCDVQYGVCFENLAFRPSLAAGDSHCCATTTSGEARCWGANSAGQVGDGIETDRPDRPTPTLVSGLWKVKSVATGAHHSCAVLEDGSVQCWGSNQWGQASGAAIAKVLSPAAIASLSGVASVSLGQSHSCALTASGSVQCWGDNSWGQIGTAASTTGPAQVALPKAVASIASGAGHVCAVTAEQKLLCWGNNSDGQVAWPADNKPAAPKDPGLSSVTAVSAGASFTCALSSDGTVQCWGANTAGQLGGGNQSARAAPTVVKGLSGIAAIASGCSHSCAIKSDGTVACWGSNQSGQIGDGATSDIEAEPKAVTGLSGVEAIAAGCRHTCAVVHGGKAYCWGDGSRGQVGDGGQEVRRSPALVAF
jgi:alpha-tubulin suppressor-like RCC1 family protein